MNLDKKIIKLLFFFVLLFDVVFASELELTSERYILYNMNDNEVIMEKDANEEVSIASLTKIMTVIVAIENINNFDDKITITNNMINDIESDVSIAGFKVGDKLTYKDLLYGAMLPSGADAVNALAILVSGNKDKFVELMNNKVDKLGLKHTHFANVVGLYNQDNYSSAYDVAQILMYALKNPIFKSVFETKRYTYSNGKTTKSTLEYYSSKSNNNTSFITGSKTGYIKKAGYCLVSTSTLNDVNYLLVTLNAFSSDKASHIKDHIKTYKYFANNYGYKTVVDNDTIVLTLKTLYAKEKEIDIKANTIVEKYLKNDYDLGKLGYKYNGINEISYFTDSGSKIGNVEIYYDGKVIDKFDLIYYGSLTFDLIGFITDNIVLIISVMLLIIIIVREFVMKKHVNSKNN